LATDSEFLQLFSNFKQLMAAHSLDHCQSPHIPLWTFSTIGRHAYRTVLHLHEHPKHFACFCSSFAEFENRLCGLLLHLCGNRKIQLRFGVHVHEWELEFSFQQFLLGIIWSNRNQLKLAFAPNNVCVIASILVLECLIAFSRKYYGQMVHRKYCEALGPIAWCHFHTISCELLQWGIRM
jgi:hypothetical protein